MNDLSFPRVWLKAINDILIYGKIVSPRGQQTREIQHRTMVVDMREPVLTIPDRKLSYQFMAAEAYWILSGDDSVAGIEPYNRNIAKFSDDGVRFFGAYGPKIKGQLNYVIGKLIDDPDTRQAGMTIWRENPPNTKDVPCTVSIFFNLRNNYLHCHVFMRSSDVWLGVPYDVFNFSMLSHLVCAKLNGMMNLGPLSKWIEPGNLYLTAASSHAYESNWSDMKTMADSEVFLQLKTPRELFVNDNLLMSTLMKLRETKPGDPQRWWEWKIS